MGQDPRYNNKRIDHSSLAEAKKSYLAMYTEAMNSIDEDQLAKAISVIREAADKGSRVFVAGNGGSAAISNHLTCDFTKGTYHSDYPPLITESLVANPSNLTAIANDFSYEESISMQVKMLAKPEDVLILISSSGNSPNIIRACEQAKDIGVKVVGLCGFSGGRLKELADVKLFANVSNYGVVEDCHQSLMHIIAQQIANERDR